MKRLVFFLIVVAAAWYGWKMYPNLTNRRPGHEAVIENASGTTLQRLVLRIGGQTFGHESLADGQKWVQPFKVNQDSNISLEWEVANIVGGHNWSQGFVTAGPMLQRHTIRIEEEGNVVYNAGSKGLPSP